DAAEPVAETSADEAPATMPVTRTARNEGLPTWMMGLIGAGGLALIGGLAFLWSKRRSKGSVEAPQDPTISIDTARVNVINDRSDLGVHLTLLNALAAADDEEGFADALDGMYAEVQDDNDPTWQEALNLAVLNAPDHPLLTPRETGLSAEDTADGLDDRTREMLGILDSTEDPHAADEPDDYEIDSTLELQEDDDEAAPAEESDDFFSAVNEVPDDDAGAEDEFTAAASDTIVVGDTDMDLADISDRLDDETELELGSKPPALDESHDEDGDSPDFSSEEQLLSDASGNEPILEADSDVEDLDLDFEFGADDQSDDADNSAAETLEIDPESELSLDDQNLIETNEDRSAEGHDMRVEAAEEDQDEPSPTDTLDLSGQSGSNDTLRMDPDELAALSEEAEAQKEDDASGPVRADDTLDLVSSEMDFEDVGDRELEAFLAEGDEEPDDEADSGESILDIDPGDEGEPALSDDDADVKLDLARAYISMDDPDSARTLLEEIVSGGSSAKRGQAQELLDDL
ncbi:MAG: FimV/HubP family polar landmark protein, partial [Pseudomonadota bacterium]